MSLTTLTAIKSRLGLDHSDVKDDALLTSFLTLVSARFENDCNRPFGYLANDTQEFQADETELRVARYPIDESQPISFDLLTKTSVGFLPVVAEYVVRQSCIVSIISRLGPWKAKLRLTYSGGYSLPDGTSPIPQGAAPPALPADLQGAALEQIAYWYQNKDRLGLKSLASSGQAGGSISHVGNLDLLPMVSSTLAKYERFMN